MRFVSGRHNHRRMHYTHFRHSTEWLLPLALSAHASARTPSGRMASCTQTLLHTHTSSALEKNARARSLRSYNEQLTRTNTHTIAHLHLNEFVTLAHVQLALFSKSHWNISNTPLIVFEIGQVFVGRQNRTTDTTCTQSMDEKVKVYRDKN